MLHAVRPSDQVKEWTRSLPRRQQTRLDATVEMLRVYGEDLPRDFMKAMKESRFHPELKELRVPSENLRVLFAIDKRTRTAHMFIGGDKTNDFKGFYDRGIPAADRDLDALKRNTGQEVSWRRIRTGERSLGR